jgi:signal transduction histidine kinase/DNA-binding response OmpR family regulator
MRLTVRPSIFRYLLYGLIAVSVVVSGLLLLANQAVRNATHSLEIVVVDHVRPLATAQRLQSRIDALRSLELELKQFTDFFAVPYHLERMQGELIAVSDELALLQEALGQEQPGEARRLSEHWQIYREAVADEIRLAQTMNMDRLANITSTRSRGAHEAISAILREMIERAQLAAAAAYGQAQHQAEQQQLLVAGVLAAGLLLLFAGLWTFGRSVSRRIKVLRNAANAVAVGRQIEPIRASGNDELTELGHAFNTMQLKVLEREDELRAAHERLEQRARAAEEATLAKSQFLANMSHEIRTPMNGVLGMLEILRETAMSREQVDYVATAHESALALLDLLNDILDLSKIEAGKVYLEQVEFDLEQVLDDAVALLAERAFAKGLELTTTIDATLPHRLHGDPGRLRQVLSNLLSNAIKFTDQGYIAVTVSPSSTPDGLPLLHFEVCDSGIGIARDYQRRIFDAFTQADGSTTRRYGGTGLGLTISSELVRAMGGQIGVDSSVGHGSTFWFTLPLEEAQPDERPQPLAKLAGTRLLVLDAEPRQRDYLVRRLASWGCAITAVASAGDALAMARTAARDGQPYRLAILADATPGPTTATLISALRDLIPDLPIALISPQGKNCQIEANDELGIDACMNRPLRKSQMEKCLLDLLGDPQPAAEESAVDAVNALHVLVAEDNPINQKVATSMLRKLACTVDIATTGREAVERMQTQEYALVLMDCQMPEMDGFEATAAIRQMRGRAARTPIVAMTAHAMPSDRQRCLAAGMDDYLTKPISLDRLRGILDRWRGHSAHGEVERATATPSQS